MNSGEYNQGARDLISTEMEARIISWVSGEASASESAELERMSAARPGIAAFRKRVEAMSQLALEAVFPDREPLRLSEHRRTELMEAFGAMRRRNLAYAAAFSVMLIAGVAWYGEMTHFIPPVHSDGWINPQPPFTIEPDPPIPVIVENVTQVPKPEIGPPQLQDEPVKIATSDFTVPIEPPHPVVDLKMEKIPTGTGDGTGPHTFTPAQLDEPPIPKYMARPVYPETMKRSGISGEALVDFIVDPSGNVRNATAVHSSQREFEEPAATAVSRWKFRPGRKDGRAVYVHMQVPIVFTLSDSP
jgi:protein TonB